MEIRSLDGISFAELEYAYRYLESVQLGELEPDDSGFDPERVAAIRAFIDGIWAEHLRVIRGS